jgi:RsiW-degrading membrane proteinase PrsW (M82 family)
MQPAQPGDLLSLMESSVSRLAASPDRGRLISSRHLWWLLLGSGAAIWLFAAVVTGLTRDTVLLPTVIILGSFLVPVSMVVLAVSRRREGHLSAEALVVGFVGGGTIGLVFAALTEVYFLPSAHGTFLLVGIIEEVAKALVLVGVGYGITPRGVRDGMALGATVGAGFAAFESSGYALQTYLNHADDRPVLDIAETETLRALLAPFGHITWTALLGGALFAASRTEAFRITARVLWTLIGIVLLHAAWDASHGWSLTIMEGLVGDGWHASWPNEEDWIGTPTDKELLVQSVVYNGLLMVNAAIGTIWLIHMWRGAPRVEAEEVAA